MNIYSCDTIKSYLNKDVPDCDILVFDHLDSTNKKAKEIAKGNTLIIADTQSAGLGRLGRSFYSPAGHGIYMSLIIKAPENAENILKITSATAVATALAIEKTCDIDTSIKWVNDIYINDKKVCGILTEAITNPLSNLIKYIVIGIGINVFKTDEIPDELTDIITSIEENITKDIKPDRNQIIGEILNLIYPILNNLDSPDYMNEYRKRSMITGKKVTAISAISQKDVEVIDIDDSGALIVKDENGNTEKIFSGEVSIKNINKNRNT